MRGRRLTLTVSSDRMNRPTSTEAKVDSGKLLTKEGSRGGKDYRSLVIHSVAR